MLGTQPPRLSAGWTSDDAALVRSAFVATRRQLRADLADEREAIRTYTDRLRYDQRHAPMYRELRADERDHAKKLKHALGRKRSA